MPNSSQILALIQSHIDGDDTRFRDIAAQIAVAEAKSGHRILADSIQKLLKKSQNNPFVINTLSPMRMGLNEFVIESTDSYRLINLVAPTEVKEKLERVVKEYLQRDLLYKHNLTNRSKILLSGPSGTGKTMTANIIANELNIPLYVVRMEAVISKYMGETSLKLGKVFELISRFRGVYLFDEFDAIGIKRGMDNEVGEMRRVLNTFLQMIERDDSDSIIIAATNNQEVLDNALFRRFDDIVEYHLPDVNQIKTLLSNRLISFSNGLDYDSLSECLIGHSHAEIIAVCEDAIKESLLNNEPLNEQLIKDAAGKRYISNRHIG